MAFLDEIKDRLGFGANEEEEEFDEELYGEDYESYASTFDEGGSFDEDEEGGYSAFKPASTRSSGSSRRRRGAGENRNRGGGPQLVSMDDLRNSTRIPESLNRDPLPARRSYDSGRNIVGHANDFALSGSEIATSSGEGSSAASRTGGSSSSYDSGQGATAKPASEVGIGTHPASSYDPYHAYESGNTSTHKPTRSISVLSPVAYGEVENVARMLRAGDAVVLSLRNTPSQLSKRILDFSFGVASALDATVDCIADKVFAITRVASLNEDELARLRNQGVI